MALCGSLRSALWAMYQARPAWSSPARVAALQERRLRRLLQFVADKSAFYREKLRGLDPSRCALTDIPITTKGELMARFDDAVTDPDVRRADLERFIDDSANVGKLFLDRYPVCHTSGSQGQSLLILHDRLALDLLFSFQMTRGNVGYQFVPWEATRRFFSPARLAIVISRPGFYPSAWVWQHMPPGLERFMKLLYVPASDPDLEQKLRDFRPTALTGNPSVLELLAQRAERFGLSDLQQVVTVAESLTERARTRIGAAFRAPVLDTYAAGECLFMTSGCQAGPGTHVNADWAILEVVDEANRPVPPGQPGHKVLLTNLANTVLPFIRYEIGDRLVMSAAPCSCGNRMPKIERVDGRSADFFWVRARDGYRPLLAYPFQHAFEFIREVREWQAIQQERNRFLVRLELLPGTTFDSARARHKLDERLDTVGLREDLEIELEVVPRLSWDERTGKFRRLVSQVGPPEDLAKGPGLRAREAGVGS